MTAPAVFTRKISCRRRVPRVPTERERMRAWTAFLKTDRDDNWETILQVLDFKLARVQAMIHNGYHGDQRARVAEIKAVRALFKRILANRYLEQLWAPYRKRWGIMTMKIKRDGSRNRVTWVFSKAKNNAANQRAGRVHRRVAGEAQAALVRDLDEAFRLIALHIRTWWE